MKIRKMFGFFTATLAVAGMASAQSRRLPQPRITVAERRAIQLCVSEAYGTVPVVDGRLQQGMDEGTFRGRVAALSGYGQPCSGVRMEDAVALFRNTTLTGGGAGTGYAAAPLPQLPAMPALPNFSAPPPSATPSDAGTSAPAPTTPDASTPAEDAAVVDVAVTPVTTTTTTTSVVAPVVIPSADGSTGGLIPESRVFVLPAIPPDAGATTPARRGSRRASR